MLPGAGALDDAVAAAAGRAGADLAADLVAVLRRAAVLFLVVRRVAVFFAALATMTPSR
jgi:hypothetical protein